MSTGGLFKSGLSVSCVFPRESRTLAAKSAARNSTAGLLEHPSHSIASEASAVMNNTRETSDLPTVASARIEKVRPGILHIPRQCGQVRIEKVRKRQIGSTLTPLRMLLCSSRRRHRDMQFDADKFRRWLQRHDSVTRSQWKVLWEGNRRRAEKAVDPDKKSERNHA